MYGYHNMTGRRRGCGCFQAEDGIRDLVRSRGIGDVYKRQRPGHAQPHANRDHAHAQDQGANGRVDEGDDAKMTPDRCAQHEQDVQAGKGEICRQEFAAQQLPTAERRCFEQPPRFAFHADAGQRDAREDEGGDEKLSLIHISEPTRPY